MRNVIDIYTEVGKKIQSLSELEQSMVVEGLAGKFHIARMRILLDDLASANSMYRQMYDTSTNSAGSAMQENEKYMESLQAKINQLKVEFEELALSVGEALLNDGMMSFFSLAKDGLNLLTKLVDIFGVLPIVLSVGATGLNIFSSRFRNLVSATGESIKIFAQATVQARSLTGGLKGLKTAADAGNASVKTLSATWKGFLSSTLVGLVFAGIGFVIEKLVTSMGKAKEKAEEVKRKNEEMLSSYEENEEQINKLVERYSELSKKMESYNLNIKEASEYRDIKNELASILPQLVTGEDQYGNKLIVSADLVKAKTQELAKQLEIQRQLNAEQSKKELEESMEVNLKQYKDAKKEIEGTLKDTSFNLFGMYDVYVPQEYKVKFVDDKGKPLLKTIDDVENKIEELRNVISKTKSSDLSKNQIELLENQLNILNNVYEKLTNEQLSLNQATSNLKANYMDYATQLINNNNKLDSSYKELASTFVASLMKMTDSSNIEPVKSTLEKIFEGDNIDATDLFKNIISEFDKLDNATESTFDDIYINITNILSSLRSSLKDTGLSDSEIDSIMNALINRLEITKQRVDENRESMKQNSQTVKDVVGNLYNLGDATDDYSSSVENNTEKLTDNMKTHELLSGVTEDEISYVNDLIFMYESLTKQKQLNAEQEALLAQTKEQLLSLYPHILSYENGEINISKEKLNAIKAEHQANSILLEAYKLSAQGKLSTEQQMTLAQASGTKARIDNIKKEIEALQLLQNISQTVATNIGRMTSSIAGGFAGLASYASSFVAIKSVTSGIGSKVSQLTSLQSSLKTSIGKIGNIVSSVNSKSGSKGSNLSSSTKKDVYWTDKYQQKLEQINSQIERQEALKKNAFNADKYYLNYLKTQLSYEQQKYNLMQDQAKSLEKQIKQGKIWTTSGYKTDKQSIDNAKSELQSLYVQIKQQRNAIWELNNDIVRVTQNRYQFDLDNLQFKLDLSKTSIQGLSVVSSQYNKELTNQLSIVQQMLKLNQNRQKQVEKDIKNTKISSAFREELWEELEDLKVAAIQLQKDLQDIAKQIVDIAAQKYKNALDDLQFSLDRSEIITGMLSEGTKEYNNELKYQASIYEKMIKLNKQHQQEIQKEISLNRLSAEAIEELKEELEDLQLEELNYQKNLYGIFETLKDGIRDNIEQIKDLHNKAIEDKIDETKKKYEGLIEEQRKRLELLDEEIEKEDRLKQLQEINQKIEDAMKDKRYSYITSEGEEILTYDKGKVQELQKERDELLKEWEREDARKAIEDEIDRLEEEQDRIIEEYEKQIEAEEKRWEEVLKAIENGTININTYLDSWYKNNKNALSEYANDINKIIDQVKNAFATLGNLPLSNISVDIGGYKNANLYTNNFTNSIKPYHDGGIVAKPTSRLADLFDRAINLKPNEVITKQLVGELNIPPKNIPNIAEMVKKVASTIASNNTPAIIPTGDSFNLYGMTVKANDPNEFVKQLQMIARMK